MPRHPFRYVTWNSLTCSTGVLLQLRNCLWSLATYQIPKEKNRWASSLGNKEVMPCHFLYACHNARQLPAHWNVRSKNQILLMFDVEEHHLVWTRGMRTILQSSMNPYNFFHNPKISYSIYRFLLKTWTYYSFGENRSLYYYVWCLQG